jgi:hypothetical protein
MCVKEGWEGGRHVAFPLRSTHPPLLSPPFALTSPADLLDEAKVPEGLLPLPYPSFPPLSKGKSMHYRSGNSSGGGP